MLSAVVLIHSFHGPADVLFQGVMLGRIDQSARCRVRNRLGIVQQERLGGISGHAFKVQNAEPRAGVPY